MVDDAVEKLGSGHTAQPYPAVNEEPLRVAANHTHTALIVLAQSGLSLPGTLRDFRMVHRVPWSTASVATVRWMKAV